MRLHQINCVLKAIDAEGAAACTTTARFYAGEIILAHLEEARAPVTLFWVIAVFGSDFEKALH